MGETVVYQGEQVPLASAGHERREELKRRHDELTAEAERLAEELGVFGCSPDAFSSDNVDREVRQATNDSGEVYVSNADKNHRYAWIYGDPQKKWGNRWVNGMKVLGWEIVGGQMREAWEHRSEGGHRWVADCILMRTRLDNYLKLQQRDREKRRARHEGVKSDLEAIGDKYGVKVSDYVPDGVVDQMKDKVVQQRGRNRRTAGR
jgi:hypothetical protein